MAKKIGKMQEGTVPKECKEPLTVKDPNMILGCYEPKTGNDGKAYSINGGTGTRRESPVQPGMSLPAGNVTLGKEKEGDDLYVISIDKAENVVGEEKEEK